MDRKWKDLAHRSILGQKYAVITGKKPRTSFRKKSPTASTMCFIGPEQNFGDRSQDHLIFQEFHRDNDEDDIQRSHSVGIVDNVKSVSVVSSSVNYLLKFQDGKLDHVQRSSTSTTSKTNVASRTQTSEHYCICIFTYVLRNLHFECVSVFSHLQKHKVCAGKMEKRK